MNKQSNRFDCFNVGDFAEDNDMFDISYSDDEDKGLKQKKCQEESNEVQASQTLFELMLNGNIVFLGFSGLFQRFNSYRSC